MKIAFLIVQLLFANSDSFFCSCSEPSLMDNEEYRHYDLIVQGLVTSIEENENHLKTITLEIKKNYKGEISGTSVAISTPKRLSYCGLNIGTGSEWIIYAYKEDGRYQTNSCTRSSELPPRDFRRQSVEDDLKFLINLKEKKNSALKYINANRSYFENIIPGKHASWEENGFVDSLQVGSSISQNASAIKLYTTVYSSEEDMDYVTVQELKFSDILDLRHKANHLDLISKREGETENSVRICMDFSNNSKLEELISRLKYVVKMDLPKTNEK